MAISVIMGLILSLAMERVSWAESLVGDEFVMNKAMNAHQKSRAGMKTKLR